MKRHLCRFAAGAALILSICPAAIFAAPVSEEQASNAVLHAVAIYHPATSTSALRFSTPFGYSQRAVRRVDQVMARGAKVGYVVNLAPSGYYLMSADDELPPWKLRSDEGDFTNLPPGLIAVLKLQMAEDEQALANLKKLNRSPNPKFHTHWQSLLATATATNGVSGGTTGAAGSYLLTTTWDQGVPYNYYCPVASGGPGGRAWAGCTACALAQILRYSSQPAAIAQNFTYTDNSGACQGTHSISDAGMGPYDWADMPDSVTTSSPLAQQEAIAQLMYHAAVALTSDFEADGTGASPSDIPYVLHTYFNYTSGYLEFRSGYSDSQWYNKIAADIDANKPVFYAMWTADGSEGHAIVCDGYQNGDEIHLNLGWSGAYNAWYNLDSIVAGGYTWTTQDAVFGITPPTKSLVSLTINGPTGINENSSAQFTATANYSDGTSNNVSPAWSVISGPGSISASGLLTVGGVGSNTTISISALYQNAASEMDVTVLHDTNQYTLNVTAGDGGSVSPWCDPVKTGQVFM